MPTLSPPKTAPVSFYIASELTSPRFAKAFAEGCGGLLANNAELEMDGPFAAFGTPATWKLFERAKVSGQDWYYGDHGIWARGQVFRIGKNTVQFQPTDEDLARATSAQFERYHAPIAPWKPRGKHIVICPNSDVYMRHHTGLGAEAWVDMVMTELAKYTDRPSMWRTKKGAASNPIARDLEDAYACVVLSSASAVDALQAGVPIVTLAPWAATARMGLTDLSQIDTPIYPENREQFFWALAEHQWTLPEIASGAAWRYLNA